MTIALLERGLRGLVLDIEGTTTPISFVSDILFPYARAELRVYLEENIDSAPVAEAVRLLEAEREAEVAGGEAPPELASATRDGRIASLVAHVEWLMERDRKSPGLKLLQGLIWERGYEEGLLQGDVFDDVPGALGRWRAAGLDIAIYSSGSVLAQELIFGTTPAGDLTEFIEHFFDTGIGPKRSPESYRRIAEAMGFAPGELLFVSDSADELKAAREAGLRVALCVRPGNAQGPTADWDVVRSFDDLEA